MIHGDTPLGDAKNCHRVFDHSEPVHSWLSDDAAIHADEMMEMNGSRIQRSLNQFWQSPTPALQQALTNTVTYK
ncbi:hypothetical protein XFEB_00682 [Xylella fastidiosa EB92.1]|jgi:hypothetical protein|nr:hypothetical protein XFEB_00682 [Xylella fastidiosa EB92.1]